MNRREFLAGGAMAVAVAAGVSIATIFPLLTPPKPSAVTFQFNDDLPIGRYWFSWSYRTDTNSEWLRIERELRLSLVRKYPDSSSCL